MTQLLTWRNPLGPEEEYLTGSQGVENRWKHISKVASTEVGLILLTLTATIETIAYAALFLASLTLYAITDKPYKFFAKLLESSSFTIIWGLAESLIYNPFFIDVVTKESFARKLAQGLNPTSISLFRLEDSHYIADWEQQNGGILIFHGSGIEPRKHKFDPK